MISWQATRMYGVRTRPQLAKQFANEVGGSPVITQLRRRNIHEIIFRPLFASGGLALGGSIIRIYLRHDDRCSTNLAQTVGHELGHSFFFGKVAGTPIRLVPYGGWREEDFCEMFASMWLAQGTNREE